MALWILQNQYAAKVFSDLRTICPDPGLTIDPAGKISYSQSISSVGCDTIALLQQLGTVSIRGENSNWSVRPQPGHGLSDIGGVAVYDIYPGTRTVDIVYDATECNGHGYITIDPQGVLIELPSDVLLFHELAHAARMFLGTHNLLNPEPDTITSENSYRTARGLPLRGSWVGGCRGSFTPGPITPDPIVPGLAQQGISSSICTPLLMSIPQATPPAICAPLLNSAPQAIGTAHTLPISAFRPGESTYQININNQTTDIFTQIVVFYKRIGLSGVVYLREENVQPGQISTFVCGLCKEFESYVVGFFIGDELVAQIPTTGNMTPQLASQLNPSDRDPCIDSWMITD